MAEEIPVIPAKTILARKSAPEWFGTDYNMNIYRGCSHACIYCDSRSECYGDDTFATVKIKENALQTLEKELLHRQKKGVVATGSMSDPYNPMEEKLTITRQALELLKRYGYGAAIATKSPLVARDADVLRGIRESNPVLVKITITAAEDGLSGRIEPKAPPSSARFAALHALRNAGLFCGVLLMPVLPFITDTDENIRAILRRAKENGAAFAYPAFGVTLRDRQRDYFYEQLDMRFPGVKKRYIRQYGTQYACGTPRAGALRAFFESECDALGLLYKMKEIIRAYRAPYEQIQTRLL